MLGGSFISSNAFATVAGTTYLALKGYIGSNVSDCPATQSGDLAVFKLDPNAADKVSVVWCNASGGAGSPIITTDPATGTSLVWTAGAEISNRLHAWNLVTGAPVFTGGGAGDVFANLRHFTTVLDAAGRLFVGADNKVFAFKP